MSRFIILALLSLLAILPGRAQDVVVTVAPVQQVLPPQLMLYFDNPGKFFNVTLTNTSAQQQEVYLALHIEQQIPASGLFVTTPTKRQPLKPIVIPAGGTKMLTGTELRNLFNHIPSGEIQATEGIIGKFNNGSFGLLPEGEYSASLVAYKWMMPQLQVPVAVSNPELSSTHFTICYTAQAPRFLIPADDFVNLDHSNVADVDVMNPLFTWTPPMVACNPAAIRYNYDFKVVEVLKGQDPSEAIERNPVVYNAKNLTIPQCIIPRLVIQTRMYTDRTYAAQITARSASANVLNYVMLENDGKSTYRLFKLHTGEEELVEEEEEEVQGGGEIGGGEEHERGGGEKGGGSKEDPWSTGGGAGDLENDSLYNMSFPAITHPDFPEIGGARKLFAGNNTTIRWTAPKYLGGEGSRSDTLKFEYDVEIFCTTSFGMEAAMKTEPIFSKHVDSLSVFVPWEDISEHVSVGNYMVMRVTPIVVKGESVAFGGKKNNIRDFALCEVLSKKYFQCSNQVEITNTNPTEKSAKELRGKVVHIGEYDLTIDEIESGKEKNTWKGKGHILWEPMGFRTHVCVKFDSLSINTDDIVYAGTCVTYSRDPGPSDTQVVEKLFSDWGIDNLMNDANIPFADMLKSGADQKAKDLAKEVNLSKYYGYVRTGEALIDDFLTGEVKDLYMPLSLPKSVNKSPVDLQIVSMKFSPTYATMDVLGEFVLPNTSYTKNDILVFGAPRLCISPNQVLPESGTVALLSDFTVVDPKSSYEITFKSPTDITTPNNGCYLAWHDYKFEILGIEADMLIPGLVKDVNGVPTTEKPKLSVKASVAKWEDWMIDDISIEPFQAEKLPGWTFTATDIVYDHSVYRNSEHMGAFPAHYNKEKAGITGYVLNENGEVVAPRDADGDWMGLFIKDIDIKFPKALEFGTEGDGRLMISAHDMFFDKSGATLTVTGTDILSAKTGKAGGWAFSLDEVNLSFLQSDFNNCNFRGQFQVPLLEGTIDYKCDIMKLSSPKAPEGEYAYIFKAKGMQGLSLDFLLAEAKFEPDQTYFLLESVPEGGEQVTTCELIMGGEVTIGGAEYIKKKLKDGLKMDVELPGIHFCGMRLSNQPSTWESKYERAMQTKARDVAPEGITLYKGDDMQFGSCYFNLGRWSLASDQKSIGGFEFSIDGYNFERKGDNIEFHIEGSVGLVSGVTIKAGTGLTIVGRATFPKDLSNIDDIDLEYVETRFNAFKVNAEFAGMKLEGTLEVSDDKEKQGAEGSLLFTMPGDLFSVNATGGYFKTGEGEDRYTYGWFYAALQSNAGIPVPPIAINGITAGFYYNCKKADDKATPQKGLIGVIAGMTISTTAGEDALSASGDMTVIYDTKHDRLSTFLFKGNVQALEGLVNAECNLVYEHSNTDKYLQLDITVDAKAEPRKLTGKYDEAFNELATLKEQLNSDYQEMLESTPVGGLSSLADQQGTPDKSKAPDSGEAPTVHAGATIGLNFRLTWMENSKEYTPVHWHLYIGEPDFDKRCEFKFLEFKSDIVSVDLGANAYLCFGNELPGNGKLPPIPENVSKFLNGGYSGEGIENATLSEAQRARQKSINDFNTNAFSSPNGGIMLGAQIYGYLNVDLGLFYLYAGATAGFDISLVKLDPDKRDCTNFSGKAGFSGGWYGSGQLYAYLYAKMGINIDLGFWSKKIDLIDAGVGGLFAMQGPKPSHFEGKARVKFNLLGGLVKIDRKFTFEAGQGCDLFYGNALDDFKLFGDLSIGYDNQEQGWLEANAISPNLAQRPYFTTEAPLYEHFRVVDETEKERLKKTYSGSSSDLDMEASRTFMFHSNEAFTKTVTLLEFSSKPRWVPGSLRLGTSAHWSVKYVERKFAIKGNDRLINYIDITKLNPNKYYVLEVSGYAKELQYGKWVDPLKYVDGSYRNVAWSTTKKYYFHTGPAETIPDCPTNLDDYIAIAYPSYLNKVKPDNEEEGATYFNAHISDVHEPTIAFYQNMSKTIFQKGTLRWRLYRQEDNKLMSEAPAKWVVTDSTCNLTVQTPLRGCTAGKKYRLVLEYEYAKSTGGAKAKYASSPVSYYTENVVDLLVTGCSGGWESGYNSTGRNVDYEIPFVGARIDRVTYPEPAMLTSYLLATDNGITPTRLLSPYYYIGYLSNYAFPGGWEFTQDRLDINITTAQSVIYTDKGGVYEGKLSASGKDYNVWADNEKIMGLSIYLPRHYSSVTPYPLPVMEDPKYGYAVTGQSRACVYHPSKNDEEKVMDYLNDMYRPYLVCTGFCSELWNTVGEMDAIDGKYTSLSTEISQIDAWYKKHRGQYIRSYKGTTSLEVPAYQFPLLWGSILPNTGGDAKKKLTMWNTLKNYNSMAYSYSTARGHEKNAEHVYVNFLGTSIYGDNVGLKPLWKRDKWTRDTARGYITQAKFTIYRCNTYNFRECRYEPLPNDTKAKKTFTIDNPVKKATLK